MPVSLCFVKLSCFKALRKPYMWQRLHQASPKRCGRSRLSWLWYMPVQRHPSPVRRCGCSNPIFVRRSLHAHQCELCGGSSTGNGGICSALPPPRTAHMCVSVTPGLCHTEALRRLRKELTMHLTAARTSYASLLARLFVARETSRRSLQSYTEWCAQAGSHVTPGPFTVKEIKGSTTSLKKEVSLETVRNAVYALRFAIAAYALPYELGYFDSVWRSIQLRMPQNYRYIQAATRDQAAAIYRILSGEQHNPMLEVAHARYSTCLGQPCYAVLLDHAVRRVVVTFRGTLSLADLISDVASGYTCVRIGANSGGTSSEMDRGLPTLVPSGFYTNVMEVGSHLIQVLHGIRRQLSDYELMCVGHSLGAVEAILFHLLFLLPTQQGCSKVRTIAIAPAPCVEHHVVEKINKMLGEETVTSWVCGLDPVARLQPRSLHDLFYPPSSVSCPAPFSVQTERVPLFSIPGRMLHIMAGGTDVVDVPVEAPWRHQMLLGKRAMLHHLPAMYGDVLHRVLAEWEKRSKTIEGEGW